MKLLNRVADILSANLSELIERYEDPELLLKQAVRQMEESIRTAMEHAVKVVTHEKILARQVADEESVVTLWRQRAESAVRRGEDHVAREALRQKRCHEDHCESLAKQLGEATRAGQTLRGEIESMRLRAEEANRKLHLLAARQHAAIARQQLLREFSRTPFGEEAFQSFERMCRKVERTEAEADARAELSGERPAVATFSDLPGSAGDSQVETELAAIKAQIGA
jgi:phage shock protein A